MQFDVNTIRNLEQLFGSPLYVFDEVDFTENYRRFEKTFQNVYPEYCVSYSYKTNYTPYICKLINQLGGYAEVVSGMEYYIAQSVGYKPERIIYNGPNKGHDGINAFLNGSIVNVDNLTELNALCEIALTNFDKSFKCGLRVNLDVGQDFVSRFGMDKKDIAESFRIVSKIPNFAINGLHCHISRCRGMEAWKKRTEFMLSLADEFFEGIPEYLDLGSGMFGAMAPSFYAQFSDVPTYEEYAEVTAKMVADHYRKENKKPILFTEPGTTLINKYVYFIGRVDAIKNIRGKTFAVLNCSEHNLGETCLLKQLPIEVIHTSSNQQQFDDVDFTGYTCLEQDVMYTGYSGKLAVGDYIVFGNTGGYSNVYKPPFIKPNCAMISVKRDGTPVLMKQVETFNDVLHTYVF